MAQIQTINTSRLPEMGRYGTVHVKRWMLFEQKLSGLSLLIYALIYQTRLNTNKQGWTVADLATWFDKDLHNIRHTLNDMVTAGLLNHDDVYYFYVKPKRHRFSHRYTEDERKAETSILIQENHIFD